MLFKDEHNFSFFPKCFFMLAIITGTILAAYLMFVEKSHLLAWLSPYAIEGNYIRQIILILCLLIYVFRLFITVFVFLKRRMGWGETLIVSGLVAFALFHLPE